MEADLRARVSSVMWPTQQIVRPYINLVSNLLAKSVVEVQRGGCVLNVVGLFSPT